uniref:Uncharacterized protein n=1 Tax=Picea glauca TaxID=3330 RepID=A0A124GNY4_PICGL|nr:hypothetical protein ABT39_MTgene114 [Picea glauca]
MPSYRMPTNAPPSKPPTLHVCIMKNVIMLSRFPTLQGERHFPCVCPSWHKQER